VAEHRSDYGVRKSVMGSSLVVRAACEDAAGQVHKVDGPQATKAARPWSEPVLPRGRLGASAAQIGVDHPHLMGNPSQRD
jgi:hypothetical protein